MKVEAGKINIVFKCDREEIPGIVNLCLDHIRKETHVKPVDLLTLAKLKWIITELLTNAVKHSGMEECTLTFEHDTEQLVLEKEDTGKPLMLFENNSGKVITWPLSGLSEPLEFQIYHNGTDSLKVRSTEPDGAAFFVEHLDDVQMPGLLIDTSEHFGLLIMTKASDEFTYTYDPILKTNRFRSIIYLKNSDYEA
ncbi:anti-sigma regulatory factor [Dyadobacter flavalbus]|uniref:anti-sigma regulatory factor n=1 Tax=Dyadobacter flavalbus TaxID=2579942 RepID=UPI00191C1A89|nr:anti-sigma regulatory factor [Dyadobacter flavalbus]